MANNHLASYLDNQKLHCSMVSYGVHGAMKNHVLCRYVSCRCHMVPLCVGSSEILKYFPIGQGGWKPKMNRLQPS